MAIVKRTKNCLDKFRKDYNKGLFSEDDGRVLKTWAIEMERWGARHIENSSEWRDHALDRQWKGYRASCFSLSGRIIYRIIDDETIEVCEVERITPDHDYKRSP